MLALAWQLMNKGFTLIELLVVVLIIGILAAIALPQYTRAVERSRMAEAVQMLGDLATAESIAYMQDGHFFEVTAGNNVGEDVQIAVPADGGTWNYASSFATASDNTTAVSITATRNGGMFDDGVLTLTVTPEGAISKTCTTNVTASTNNTFCGVANAMGYSGSGAAAGGN